MMEKWGFPPALKKRQKTIRIAAVNPQARLWMDPPSPSLGKVGARPEHLIRSLLSDQHTVEITNKVIV